MEREAASEGLAPEDRTARDIKEENGALYRKGLLWVPQGLIQQILESEHDTKVAGHMGQDKTIELI